MKSLKVAMIAFAPVLAALLVVYAQAHQHPSLSRSPVAHLAKSAGCAAAPSPAKRYLGVVVYKPQQVTLPQFVRQGGVRPGIIQYYIDFGSSFDLARATQIYQASAFPSLQLDPYKVSLRGIALGHYDTYLRAQARATERFRCPMALSFGHEMDGPWYQWGDTHVSPKVFIAAWRHVHSVFASAGARNVIWTWTISRVSRFTTAARTWWPGSQYVNWVGIDGYFRRPQDNFTSIFSKTLTQLRTFTSDPVLLTETGVTRGGPEGAEIRNLFRGARRAGVFGVIWFDVNAMEKWTLAGRPPAALAAFKQAASRYVSAPG